MALHYDMKIPIIFHMNNNFRDENAFIEEMRGKSGMRTLLPESVIVEETTADVSEDVLLPEEQAVIAGAVPKRRLEFATVRSCARRALAQLGYPPSPILPGPGREPLWPPGIVGSLTHCEGYRAAAVATTRDFISLGIDAEVNEMLPDNVLPFITTENELKMFSALKNENKCIMWDRVIFSAKESIYKAWYCLTHRWLDFKDCEVNVNPITSQFSGRILVHAPSSIKGVLERFSGSWSADDTHVYTAITCI